MSRFKKAIRERKEASGLSVRQLAERSGLSKTTVSDAITGATWPKEETLEKLAEALGCSIDELLGIA